MIYFWIFLTCISGLAVYSVFICAITIFFDTHYTNLLNPKKLRLVFTKLNWFTIILLTIIFNIIFLPWNLICAPLLELGRFIYKKYVNKGDE